MQKKISSHTEAAQSVSEEEPAVQSAAGQASPAKAAPKSWAQALSEGDDGALKAAVDAEITAILANHKLDDYFPLLLWDDEDSITNFHSDRLYAAASEVKGKKDILLILQSSGGSIEPAYLISKTLKRLANNKFIVAIPRRAKSAATLVSLGADEIHMGLMSQLGPIDPQISGLPVLALGNALDVIADLTCRFPQAAGMFTNYLAQQAPIRVLGYYQRVGESAVQYGERLLAGKKLPEGVTAEAVAKHLVMHYKDHSFVIDADEASQLLGEAIVKQGTPEYLASDEIFRLLDTIQTLLSVRGKQMWFVGKLGEMYVGKRPPRKQT